MMTVQKENITYKERGLLNKIIRATGFCLIVAIMTLGLQMSRPAQAAHSGDGAYDDTGHYDQIVDYIYDLWIGSMMKMTEQFSAVMMQQVEIIGALFDAKFQLETQALIQSMEAQAHKDYRPDVGVCIIGTNVRSLASSENIAKTNAKILSEALLKREVLSENSVGALGYYGDKKDRITHFKDLYCDENDNNEGLRNICTVTGGNLRANNDINFGRTVDKRLTLDIDFTDTNLTDAEEDILALSKNLFSHRVFTRIDPESLGREYPVDEFQEMRSLIAMRGVARNSWGHLVGMKAPGTPGSATFIREIASQLGIPAGELDEFIGQNPSYFAQMDVLTKKLFQSPDFYTNLYTSPANIDRIGVSLQALELMQNRDRFESALRREMLISMILEVKTRWLQEDVNNQLLGLATARNFSPQ